MSYMVMQRYTTAIHEGYAGRTDLLHQLTKATELREWVASLEVPAPLRAELAEPIRAIEEAFEDLVRSPQTYAR